MKIHIPVLENMLAMARQHVALEQEAARRYKRDQQMDDEEAGGKIKMPAEDTNRTIQFDEPKKNPP
ncbi:MULTISPECIES: hypothetical protein [Pseudomonas]|jgi:hypothetical protein|uniref:Uncharacterized protein n=1 Tax=Pseudomonas reactans TaxID=117680 RepID=A0A7Y8FZL8_9PSED|nr:hypothetical protein [Pseudomonas reactans]NWD78999.1 hypothetical protein [Pseudomonas reactans]NWE88492.1 hypothetical protein [Pseudomonas reactans]